MSDKNSRPALPHLDPVDAALDYAAFYDGHGGTPGLWLDRDDRGTLGDCFLRLNPIETRPFRCMRILAAEVIRQREEIARLRAQLGGSQK